MTVFFCASPMRALLAFSTLIIGPLGFSLLVAPIARADHRNSERDSERDEDLSFASQRASLAKTALVDLIADYEESEVDALLGRGSIVRLVSDAGEVTSALQSHVSDDDVRLTSAKDAFESFESSYKSAVKRYDAELEERCFDGSFVLVVGNVLDDAGGDMWRAARALGFNVKLPHPARLEDVCGEIDGK